MGLLLIVLPWSSFWERNYFVENWTLVEQLVTNNFVRGAISGLGVVNLIAGFTDLAAMFLARGQTEVGVPDERSGSA